ncbi:unnamed protein product [Cylicocyclus nassatus]|uniref:Uncharacterized protein n=1 Tax=Cylicocyclus nassatus TaxID=53992 RepID=A0AA36GH18_CYLNA|nr:unnamed protein product [Cylicocyclus nassatus]
MFLRLLVLILLALLQFDARPQFGPGYGPGMYGPMGPRPMGPYGPRPMGPMGPMGHHMRPPMMGPMGMMRPYNPVRGAIKGVVVGSMVGALAGGQ